MHTQHDDAELLSGEGARDGGDEWTIRAVPPAVVGFLLILTVLLACGFYVAAQLVQTP